MTFSVIGRCARSGKMGFAIATGTPAIGRRAICVLPGCAVVVVQAGHNHYLLNMATLLAESGFGAGRIFDALASIDPYAAQRQLMFLSRSGPGEARTGDCARPWAGHSVGDDFAVAGNVLAGSQVVDEMARAMKGSNELELEDRLMRALEAGRDAGGQADGERSAALFVIADHAYPLFDLRVDLALEPTGELRRAFEWYRPLAVFYEECYEKGIPAKYKEHLRSIGWQVNPFGPEA